VLRFRLCLSLACALASAVSLTGCSAPVQAPTTTAPFDLDDVTITDLQQRMESGRETARSIVEKYLKRIDAIDRELLETLNRRTRVVEEIGRVKREAHLPIYEPKREDQVFANVANCNGGPITHEAVRRIFERIIDEMRTIQRMRMVSDGDKKC